MEVRRLRSRVLTLAALSALVALLTVAPAAQARPAVSLSLDVTFFANGTIAVTLPDGTPVGSTSGAPTLIPAGFYTLLLSGPGGCTQVPHFDLKGPGESIVDNMTEGEMANTSYNAYFMPNSTYTWRSDAAPTVVHTFTTSADIVGTATGFAAAGPSGIASDKHSTATSEDLLGSAILPFRGTLTGAVSAAGRLTLAYKGKSVTALAEGRYRITVTDKSSTDGFLVEKLKHAPVSVTGTTFVGKRSASVALSAGKWLFTPRLGKTTYSIVVS